MGVRECHQKGHLLEFNQITPLIYAGNNMCCQMHFNKKLLKKGIKADISLEEKKSDIPLGVKYYLWLPTKDHHPPTTKQLISGARFLDGLVKNKIKTYIHCKRGHTRTGTFLAAYFVMKGKTLKEAIEFIKKKRKCVHITPRQMAALRKFSKRYLNHM